MSISVTTSSAPQLGHNHIHPFSLSESHQLLRHGPVYSKSQDRGEEEELNVVDQGIQQGQCCKSCSWCKEFLTRFPTKITDTIASVRRNRQYVDDHIVEDIDVRVQVSREGARRSPFRIQTPSSVGSLMLLRRTRRGIVRGGKVVRTRSTQFSRGFRHRTQR